MGGLYVAVSGARLALRLSDTTLTAPGRFSGTQWVGFIFFPGGNFLLLLSLPNCSFGFLECWHSLVEDCAWDFTTVDPKWKVISWTVESSIRFQQLQIHSYVSTTVAVNAGCSCSFMHWQFVFLVFTVAMRCLLAPLPWYSVGFPWICPPLTFEKKLQRRRRWACLVWLCKTKYWLGW